MRITSLNIAFLFFFHFCFILYFGSYLICSSVTHYILLCTEPLLFEFFFLFCVHTYLPYILLPGSFAVGLLHCTTACCTCLPPFIPLPTYSSHTTTYSYSTYLPSTCHPLHTYHTACREEEDSRLSHLLSLPVFLPVLSSSAHHPQISSGRAGRTMHSLPCLGSSWAFTTTACHYCSCACTLPRLHLPHICLLLLYSSPPYSFHMPALSTCCMGGGSWEEGEFPGRGTHISACTAYSAFHFHTRYFTCSLNSGARGWGV